MPFLIPFGFTGWTSLKLVRGTAFRTLQMSCHILEMQFIVIVLIVLVHVEQNLARLDPFDANVLQDT